MSVNFQERLLELGTDAATFAKSRREAFALALARADEAVRELEAAGFAAEVTYPYAHNQRITDAVLKLRIEIKV